MDIVVQVFGQLIVDYAGLVGIYSFSATVGSSCDIYDTAWTVK